jgi:DNA-directed RNA polymerase subunit beta
VPLLSPEAPLIGTGIEFQAALDSGQVVVARDDGEVVGVTSDKITLRNDSEDSVYQLRKYDRSNQSTCIDQRPIVSKGAAVRKGEVIADSSSTDNGELALGQNVLVAFMSWEGGNYEDAILVSESLVREDKFRSVHIEKHEVEARDTKLGAEEITRDIPNVGDEALKNLDEEGIIYVGAEVGPDDILVGKITPKGETDLTPEEKLLRAIFGEKAREVKDSSLRLPHGEKGRVCETKVFSRDEYQGLRAGVERMVRVSVAQRRKLTVGDKMAGRHGNKGVISQIVPIENMPFLPDGTPVEIILNPLGVPSRMNIGQILETHLGWASDRLGFSVMSPVFDGADEDEISAELARAWLADRAKQDLTRLAWEWLKENEYDPDRIENDESARKEYLLHEGGVSGKDSARMMDDEVFRSRFWLRQWLEGKGFDPNEILVFEGDNRSIAERQKADRSAERVCNELWLRDMGHEVSGSSEDDLVAEARKVSKETGWPLPTSGKTVLYDGKTGKPFDEPVTVGIIYMMKLAHLVEDKVHARSTGPYSLVTQQPLGGKAQFGGQRFGEMEVWALEAYGAAHTLREMLTVKSDDVTGRVRTYEAIVKGDRITGAGIPESFHVLVKELQSLGLSIDVLDEEGNVIHLGKRETDYTAMPRLGLGFGRGEFD